jgi:hypothetical protein
MKTRILITALALVFGFTTLARADEFTSKTHKLKADFPMEAKTVQKKIDSDAGEVTSDVYVCGGDGKFYMLMVVRLEGKVFQPLELSEFMDGFIPNLKDSFKGAKLLKETELELNKNCPAGRCYLVQHDGGMIVLWATVKNGKVYLAFVGGPSKNDLGSNEAKEFLASVVIGK